MQVQILPEIKKHCPKLCLAIIECHIKNTSYDKALWEKIEDEMSTLRATTSLTEIKQKAIIEATRQVYKKCGKDPNRYRPSSEALCRRIINGKGLYQISTAVDLINLLSFKTGYCIGAFDAGYIEGDLSYGIGRPQEDYTGIGRGKLNVEGLPILRDAKGGIGTPTSDEERTHLRLESTSLLVNINGYLGKTQVKAVAEECLSLLQEHLEAQCISLRYIE